MPKAKEKLVYCGAKTRAGTPCKRPAGWGTDHAGTGKCKLHGGCSEGAPKKNKNAEKHGLFSKYLPQETLELVNEIEEISLLDILWDNIKIQYAAIIRAQQIMYVKNQNELVKEIKKDKEAFNSQGDLMQSEKEYELQFAWDRQDRFLTSQARAMTNLTNMIMKYDELLKSNKATEEQQLRINKLKADINKTNAEIDKIKGISEEIEDTTELDSMIYGDSDEN